MVKEIGPNFSSGRARRRLVGKIPSVLSEDLPDSFLKSERKITWNLKGGEDLGRDERGETMIRTYCIKIGFQLKKKYLFPGRRWGRPVGRGAVCGWVI